MRTKKRPRLAKPCAAGRPPPPYSRDMQADLISGLEARRTDLCARWEDLLRVERAESPLASPDILVHMFRLTLGELFGSLRAGTPPEPPAAGPDCPCGRNPLLTYFNAGRQAVREALILAQAARLPESAAARDTALAELEGAYSRIAHREIGSFCAVCQFRRPVDGPATMVAVC
jgi:hypothetical protein